MKREFFEGREFTNIKASQIPLEAGEYEDCSFKSCDFSDSDLSNMVFLNCEFRSCNFSMTNLDQASMIDLKFNGCKILGIRFEECNQLISGLLFENCSINLSSFCKLKLKNTIFRNSQVNESDFTGTDLSESVFEKCDLSGSVFDHTNLSKVDFRTAFNYSIDPEKNFIKKARFSTQGIRGLLDKYEIEIEEE
jgi:fluoroquinolone resistance protein